MQCLLSAVIAEMHCPQDVYKRQLHRYVIEELAPAFLREGVSEARLCSEICTAIVDLSLIHI